MRTGEFRQKRTQEPDLNIASMSDINSIMQNHLRERTERDQLWGDLLDLTQTLRDGVGWWEIVSTVAHNKKRN